MMKWDKTSKNTYQQLCQEYDLPIFYHPWWLDLVCKNGEWAAIWSQNKRGEIQGVWPYFLSQRWGIHLVAPPMLTPHLGPWVIDSDNKMNGRKRWKFELSVYAALIKNLPTVPIMRCKCAPELKNSLPFFWTGFQQQTRYTFRLNNLEQPDMLFQQFSSTLHNHIRAAKKQLTIRMGDTADLPTLHHLVGLSLSKKAVKTPFSLPFLGELDAAVIRNSRRMLLLAEDETGKTYAAAYILFDRHIAYLLLLGSDPNIRYRGAASFVIWEAIQQANRYASIFDFEGSMLPGVANFFAEFGGTPEPYFLLTRGKNRWWNAAYWLWTTVFSKSPIASAKQSINIGQVKS